VYLAIGSTDMRKAINGLSILVEQHLSKDLLCMLEPNFSGMTDELIWKSFHINRGVHSTILCTILFSIKLTT
jgi:hypothetical protein